MPADRRLPGCPHAFTFGYPEDLWLRDDHLLCVTQTTVCENYQRFYYRDIEAITLVPTATFKVLNGCFLLPLALGAVLFLVGVPPFALAVFPAAWLILTAINLALGPTCKTVLRTRVNTRTLASLRRTRAARKALALLTARILAAQTAEAAPGLPAELAPSPPPDLGTPSAALRPPDASLLPPPPLPAATPVPLRWHRALAVLTALQALLALNAALYPSWQLSAALLLLMVATTLVCVPALIAQRHRAAPAALRQACWWFTGFQFLFAYLVLIIGGALLGARAQDNKGVSVLLGNAAELFADNLVLRVLFAVYAVVCVLFTVWQASGLRSVRAP